jgi:hypothetical protein
MKDQNKTEARIKERLDEIKAVPSRSPQAVSRGRAQFLSQAVSASESQRHKGWISKSRKEHFAMNTMIATLMIVGLLFGGGATVNAAQDDLPNEPLYGLKMWSEDLGLQFQDNAEAKVDRLMDLAQIRLQEMTQLAEVGQPVPDQVRQRLEQHIQQALQTCTTMDDPTLDRTLLKIRDRLQQQEHDMGLFQLKTQDQQQLLTQTRTMLRERLYLVEDGLLNHEAFRNTVRNGLRNGQEDDLTPPAQNGNGQQNGQPTMSPGGPNTDSGNSNTNPGEPNIDPGGPNTDPGGPNTDPGGPNTDPGEPNADSGGNTNGTDGSDSGSGGTNANGNGGGK